MTGERGRILVLDDVPQLLDMGVEPFLLAQPDSSSKKARPPLSRVARADEVIE